VRAAGLDECRHGALQVLGLVRGADLHPDASLVHGDYGVREANDVDALVQQVRRHAVGKGGVSEHDGDDRMAAGADGKPGFGHRLPEPAGIDLLLKHNFSENGRYEDASWAYVKEQQMRKRGHRHRCERDFRTWRHLAPWAWKWAAELVTGYGEQPWRTAICAVLVVLLFTAIYAWFGLVSAAYSGPASVQSQGAPAPSSIWDALIYSVATFCTVSYTALNPVGRAAHMLASAESAIGLALVGVFLWTLGNRISRG
jgi:Ion channel